MFIISEVLNKNLIVWSNVYFLIKVISFHLWNLSIFSQLDHWFIFLSSYWLITNLPTFHIARHMRSKLFASRSNVYYVLSLLAHVGMSFSGIVNSVMGSNEKEDRSNSSRLQWIWLFFLFIKMNFTLYKYFL